MLEMPKFVRRPSPYAIAHTERPQQYCETASALRADLLKRSSESDTAGRFQYVKRRTSPILFPEDFLGLSMQVLIPLRRLFLRYAGPAGSVVQRRSFDVRLRCEHLELS